MKRLSETELDEAAVRLEEIRIEGERLHAKLLEQVEEYGFSPHVRRNRSVFRARSISSR